MLNTVLKSRKHVRLRLLGSKRDLSLRFLVCLLKSTFMVKGTTRNEIDLDGDSFIHIGRQFFICYLAVLDLRSKIRSESSCMDKLATVTLIVIFINTMMLVSILMMGDV